jgi:hypothetical protein
MKTIKLYYHKTDGGAEYLTDRWTLNTNGTKEGVFCNARYIVRLDNRTLTISRKQDEDHGNESLQVQ